MRIALKMMSAVAIAAIAAGCQSTKPLEENVASLKTQVNTLQTEVDTLKRNETAATQAATDAQRNAQAASTKADQALSIAQANEQKIAATNETMDRMYRRSASK
jgi:cell division septum initiation protein DivIVA